MKQIVMTGLIAFTLGACTPPVAEQEDGLDRVTTRAEYLDQVADRQIALTDGSASFVVSSGGTITGQANGLALTGTWNWRDGTFCRTVFIGGESRGSECALVYTDGSIVRVERLTSGRVSTYVFPDV